MPDARFPTLDDAERIARLSPPTGRVRMVLDTDTANEIDDQFAVVHALLSGERLAVEAIYAAPFVGRGAATAAEGVAASEAELLRLLERLELEPDGRVLRGAGRFLPDAETPVLNPASEDLIERARATPAGEVLYVAAIGAITDVAAALLIEPGIVERIAVVWLGGQPLHAPSADEYNLRGDPDAVRVVLRSGVPLLYIPCYGAASHLLTTTAELDRYVRPSGRIGEYLADIFAAHDRQYPGASKEIWDLAAIGALIDPAWTPRQIAPAPGLADDLTWLLGDRTDGSRWHPIGAVTYVQRNPIFADLFGKLAEFAQGERRAAWAGSAV